jgi:hypothetical protein
VHHPDSPSGDLDDALPRQSLTQDGLVHVPVDGFHGRTECPELVRERRRREVAPVQDQVRAAEQLRAGIRKGPRPTRQVRVGDDGDAGQRA